MGEGIPPSHIPTLLTLPTLFKLLSFESSSLHFVYEQATHVSLHAGKNGSNRVFERNNLILPAQTYITCSVTSLHSQPFSKAGSHHLYHIHSPLPSSLPFLLYQQTTPFVHTSEARHYFIRKERSAYNYF